MILSDQSFKIKPANEDKKDDYSLERLVNDRLVNVNKDLRESTELHMERNKIHYVIQIFDQNGTYKCCIGYKKTEDYDYNNDIDAMTDDEGNVMIFSSIHSAAVEAELDAEKKIVEKEKNRPASMNPGKSPKEWILRRAGRPEYEGKKIGEVYKSLSSDLQH